MMPSSPRDDKQLPQNPVTQAPSNGSNGGMVEIELEGNQNQNVNNATSNSTDPNSIPSHADSVAAAARKSVQFSSAGPSVQAIPVVGVPQVSTPTDSAVGGSVIPGIVSITDVRVNGANGNESDGSPNSTGSDRQLSPLQSGKFMEELTEKRFGGYTRFLNRLTFHYLVFWFLTMFIPVLTLNHHSCAFTGFMGLITHVLFGFLVLFSLAEEVDCAMRLLGNGNSLPYSEGALDDDFDVDDERGVFSILCGGYTTGDGEQASFWERVKKACSRFKRKVVYKSSVL